MAYLDSDHWDHRVGVCTKHQLPELPCPACVATRDLGLQLVLTRTERETISWGMASVSEFAPADLADFPFAEIRTEATGRRQSPHE